jgi:SIR2-like domain
VCVPGLLRKRGSKNWPQLTITTNYDDLLERAYEDHEESFDLVVYRPDDAGEGESRGTFYHINPDKECRRIEDPRSFSAVSLQE